MSAPILAALGRSNNEVFVVFNVDVTRVSTGLPYENGFVLTADGVIVAVSAATKVTNGIWLSVAAPFADAATVSVAYTGVNLVDAATSTFPVAAFTDPAPFNGLAFVYPPSTVIASPLSITNNVVTAQFTVSLNSIDRAVVAKYAPTFDQGGSFGYPPVLPTVGYPVPSRPLPIRDGAVYAYPFTIAGNTEWASLAASAWLSAMLIRIATSLNTARLLDESIVFGAQTVTRI